MKFPTAKEMYAHLAELVDDEEFIMRAVRVHFPEYRREQKRSLTIEQARKSLKPKEPSPVRTERAKPDLGYDGWYNSGISDKAARDNIAIGSENLLRAIWRAHPKILRNLASRGLNVAIV